MFMNNFLSNYTSLSSNLDLKNGKVEDSLKQNNGWSCS